MPRYRTRPAWSNNVQSVFNIPHYFSVAVFVVDVVVVVVVIVDVDVVVFIFQGVTKHEFSGMPGSYRVCVIPPKVAYYWKRAKRGVRYLMSEHKELMDCPSDGQPKILELAAAPLLLFITFQVPRSDGYTADYEARVHVLPGRRGIEVMSFRKIEGSEKLIEMSDTTTAGDDLRILSPPSSDDEGMGLVYRHGERHTENSSEDSDMDSSEDSGEDDDEMPGMKHHFPNIPDRIRACPPESEYWSKAERAVDSLMDTQKDVMDFPPIGRPKILELGLRAKDNMVLYIAFQVPLKNGYTTDYEAIAFVSPVEECDVCSFKKVKNSERPIESSDTTGWSLVSDDRCTLSHLSTADEGSTMGSGAGYGDESQGDGSMMCVDADDDLSKSGTGLLSK